MRPKLPSAQTSGLTRINGFATLPMIPLCALPLATKLVMGQRLSESPINESRDFSLQFANLDGSEFNWLIDLCLKSKQVRVGLLLRERLR